MSIPECEIILKDRSVIYHDKITHVNSWLIEKNNLNESQIEEILRLHLVRMIIVEEMLDADPSEFKAYSIAITNADFNLQDAWGFDRDESFHYWFDVPHCTCPKMDNRDAMGTPYAVINGSCPVHGGG